MYFNMSDGITTYRVDTKGRFLKKSPNGTESIILENVTGIFDGIADSNEVCHFLIQSYDGSLVYLCFDGNEWKKYELFKSKTRNTSIKEICLANAGQRLCAFYCMNHKGKNLLIRHIFSSSDLHLTPDVEDVLDIRADFHLASSNIGHTLTYRDISGRRCEKTFDGNMHFISRNYRFTNDDIFHLRCSQTNTLRYYAYSAERKGYTAILFATDDNIHSQSTITFGVSKNCIPHICITNKEIIIQWTENNRIMQSVSRDFGKSFSAPAALAPRFNFIRFRTPSDENMQKIDVCAACEESLSVPLIVRSPVEHHNITERSKGMNPVNTLKDFSETTFFLKKLAEIESDVNIIGKELEKICEFLDKLVVFKTITGEDSYIEPIKAHHATLSEKSKATDIGAVNEENIKLFESIDPEKIESANPAPVRE